MSAIKIIEIIELKNKREIYGGDSRSINKHSIRVYKGEDDNIEFTLNLTLDGCPPFYTLYYFAPGLPLPSFLEIDSDEYWGDGLSWEEAEDKAIKRIREFLELKRKQGNQRKQKQ